MGVVVDPGGPANALIPRLEEYGLTVHQVNARELAQACGGFYDAVQNRGLRHRGSEPLNQAVQGRREALARRSPGRLIVAGRSATRRRCSQPCWRATGFSRTARSRRRLTRKGSAVSLLRRERVNVGDYTLAVQRFLSGVRSGMTDQDAAEDAGVTLIQVRTWLRDEDFAAHYQRARQGEGGAQCLNHWDLLAEGEDMDPARRARIEAAEARADAFLDAQLDRFMEQVK